MAQWLIGIFLRFLSSKDDLINCAGMGKLTFLTCLKFFPAPVFFVLNLTGHLPDFLQHFLALLVRLAFYTVELGQLD